jgi:hypothetical protein
VVADDLASASLAIAKRFAAGATLWCCAPPWPHHARHVAVEFVHPVIVGKRALPAVALTDGDPVAELRSLCRSGDLLLALAPASDGAVRDAMRRAPAWGLETVWIGCGPRPEPGAAQHVLWVESDDALAANGGAFVLRYHLLWELTHVWFEHPGLLEPSSEVCLDDVCVTCSDEGRLAEIVHARAVDLTAEVRTATGTETIDTTLVGGVAPGDLVLVHGGTAITRVDSEQ